MNVNRYFLDSHFHDEKCIGTVGVAAMSAALGLIGSKVQGQDGYTQVTDPALEYSDREWQSYWYDRSRADNLSDWNKENEYNSPANQRKLLEEAGYNPALFGDQIAGSSEAGSIKQANPQSPSYTSSSSYSATNTDTASMFNGLVSGVATCRIPSTATT